MRNLGAWLAPLLLVFAVEARATDWVELTRVCSIAGTVKKDVRTAAAACPEATAALEVDPWSGTLDESPADLPIGTLRQLATLAGHYRQPMSGPQLDEQALDAALADLSVSAAAPPSLWERFSEWLAGWLRALFGEEEGNPPWLEELSISDRVMLGIWYTSVTILALLAIAVIVNEIRQQSRRRLGSDSGRISRAGNPESEDARRPLARHSPREELADLLRLLVGRLQSVGALVDRRSLTHRELAAATGLSEDQSLALRTVSAAAERVVYGTWIPAPEDIHACLECGHRLLDELKGEPA